MKKTVLLHNDKTRWLSCVECGLICEYSPGMGIPLIETLECMVCKKRGSFAVVNRRKVGEYERKKCKRLRRKN